MYTAANIAGLQQVAEKAYVHNGQLSADTGLGSGSDFLHNLGEVIIYSCMSQNQWQCHKMQQSLQQPACMSALQSAL